MCKGTTMGEGELIYKNTFHEDIQHLYTKNRIYVDKCIASEVKKLLRSGVATWGMSCCGHGREQSQAWLHPEYVDKAIELGYRVFTIHDMEEGKHPALMLKQGTQSSILQYEGYIHGDENGMFEGKSPTKLTSKPYLGWE